VTDFAELYQEIIRDHYRSPRNRCRLDEKAPAFDNPSCGDRIRFAVDWEEGNGKNVVSRIRFDGSGCSISMSSASIMTEFLAGKTREEALAAIDRFLEVFRGERDIGALAEMGDAVALGGVAALPVRVKCATLAWHGIRRVLGDAGNAPP
jgi:nitrogen fixation protein NifU and related proteins